MLIFINFFIVVCVSLLFFLQCATFGKHPAGNRLEKIKKSPNFRDGIFHNLVQTTVEAKNSSYWKMLKDYYNRPKSTVPSKDIPSIKIDLKNIATEKPTIIWFGHSSYLIKIKDMNILVDPVFSGHSSPFSFIVKAFEGSNQYSIDDFPDLDMVIISHDHYDHLDYKSILALKNKTKKFYMPLGVGAHFEDWGISESQILELDWWEDNQISNSIKITATPARHFSGRLFSQFKTLWASYVLEIEGFKIFIGGDSGYDDTFKKINQKFGVIDIAMLECGQYNEQWPTIHMFPEETVKAALDLKTKVLFPVHWGKFELAFHPWNDSIRRASLAAKDKQKLTTPIIGELIILDSVYPDKKWWDF
jgi:L-ascorbate metabolism protein UlaG (beta-lactamase superfamily)